MPPLHRLAVLAVVTVLSLLVLVGCTSEPSSSGPTPDVAGPGSAGPGPGTSLEELPVKRLSVPRSAFCDVVPPALVSAALAVETAPEVEAYGNGDRAKITRGVRDVAHEFSCTWDGPEGQARAWVLAPPVDRALARDLASALRGTRGCADLTGAAAYGAPSVGVECRAGTRTRVLRAGLLGDAWLTCSLVLPEEVPAEERVRRSADWCAGLLTTLADPSSVTS